MAGYTIDQVSWHTKSGSELPEKTLRRFRAVAVFLQDNRLLSTPLLSDRLQIDEDFRIHSSDLTAEGLEVVRRHYDRWLRAVDRGKPPEDITLLQKGLAEIRARKDQP